MNKLTLVVLSIALFAHFIPSVLSAGEECTSDLECLNSSNNTQCCMQNPSTSDQTCQTVPGALLTTTYDQLNGLTGNLVLLSVLRPIVNNAAQGLPLSFNELTCYAFDKAQQLAAHVGGTGSLD